MKNKFTSKARKVVAPIEVPEERKRSQLSHRALPFFALIRNTLTKKGAIELSQLIKWLLIILAFTAMFIYLLVKLKPDLFSLSGRLMEGFLT